MVTDLCPRTLGAKQNTKIRQSHHIVALSCFRLAPHGMKVRHEVICRIFMLLFLRPEERKYNRMLNLSYLRAVAFATLGGIVRHNVSWLCRIFVLSFGVWLSCDPLESSKVIKLVVRWQNYTTIHWHYFCQHSRVML
jgi:hypothetical protein